MESFLINSDEESMPVAKKTHKATKPLNVLQRSVKIWAKLFLGCEPVTGLSWGSTAAEKHLRIHQKETTAC